MNPTVFSVAPTIDPFASNEDVAQLRLAVYNGPLEAGGELEIFRPSHGDVVIVRGRAELAESELLALVPTGMDAIFRHVDEVVSYVEAYDSVIHAIVRADSRDYDMIPARAEVEFTQMLFHGSLIEAVMGVLFYDHLAGSGFELLDKLHRRAVLDEGVSFAEKGEFRMILRSHRLNVDDLSIGFAKSVQQGSNAADDRFDSGAVSLTAFSLHVDNDESGAVRR
jgi:hypothetical protein